MLDVKRNLTTMTDFYELTMSAGYLDEGYKDKIAVFDMFFRKVPDGGGYAIMAGLEQFINAVDSLEFTEEDINYLRSTGAFNEQFLDYLRNFKLHCNIWAIEEGMPIFPQEPIVTVEGPAIECQLLETLLLVTFNHQCLIATKANRICRAAAGRPVMEFGARRAQGYDAAYFGARASYIGGCGSTSCVMAARDFGIPASGTMAHSWVQMFPTEYDAFKKYAEMYPDNCVLLVDTYNVLRHGVPDAIKVFDEVLKPMGKRPKGVRIDSGDIAYLSKKARQMLDAAGYPDCTVCASNSKLAALIAKAKANSVPNDNIQRIIKRAEGGDKTEYEAITYEGYGPGGIAVMVETLTDNRNRTAANMRHYFDKFGGNLGQMGCVGFMFTQKGVIVVDLEDADPDQLMMDALDAGAEDFDAGEEAAQVTTDPDNFTVVCNALEEKGYKFISADVAQVPSTTTALTDPDQLVNMGKLLDALDDDDDVQNAWTTLENEEDLDR